MVILEVSGNDLTEITENIKLVIAFTIILFILIASSIFTIRLVAALLSNFFCNSNTYYVFFENKKWKVDQTNENGSLYISRNNNVRILTEIENVEYIREVKQNDSAIKFYDYINQKKYTNAIFLFGIITLILLILYVFIFHGKYWLYGILFPAFFIILILTIILIGNKEYQINKQNQEREN